MTGIAAAPIKADTVITPTLALLAFSVVCNITGMTVPAGTSCASEEGIGEKSTAAATMNLNV